MATIVTIDATDTITSSRADLNTNFSNLNTDKIETSTLDTDTTLAANSDTKIATQKAVKTYVDAGGNVNASTTAKGIVEEATQAEVDAGTATGGTSARLYVNPSTLPSALTIMPYPNIGFDETAVVGTLAVGTNTTLNVGQIVVPFRMTINKVSFYASAAGVAGTLDVTLYSEDGQTQLFSVTTASISGAGVVTTAVSSVSIGAGVYYIAINPNSTASVNVAVWTSNNNEFSATGLLGGVSSEPVLAGTVAISAGTPAATLTPASITAVKGKTLVCRLDN